MSLIFLLMFTSDVVIMIVIKFHFVAFLIISYVILVSFASFKIHVICFYNVA